MKNNNFSEFEISEGDHKPDCILICVHSMWGALEWIVPAIKYLHENYESITIHFLITRLSKEELFGDNKELCSLAEEISDFRLVDLKELLGKFLFGNKRIALCQNLKSNNIVCRVLLKFFKKQIIKKYIKAINPDAILMDSNLIYDTARQISGIRIGNFLTAPSLSLAPYVLTDKSVLKKRVKDSCCFDFYFVDNVYSEKFYSTLLPGKQVVNIGCPKYDSKWFGNGGNFCKKIETQKIGKIKTIVILLKNESSALFNHINFSDLLYDILDACDSVGGLSLVLKPHPRQNIFELKKVIAQFPELDIVISYKSVGFLAEHAQSFVAMPSGIIFDAVLTNKPVVEYFNFVGLNKILHQLYKEVPVNIIGGIGCLVNEKLTSVFRYEKIVLGVDTNEQLVSCLKGEALRAGGNYLANLRKIYPDYATKRAALAMKKQMEYS